MDCDHRSRRSVAKQELTERLSTKFASSLKSSKASSQVSGELECLTCLTFTIISGNTLATASAWAKSHHLLPHMAAQNPNYPLHRNDLWNLWNLWDLWNLWHLWHHFHSFLQWKALPARCLRGGEDFHHPAAPAPTPARWTTADVAPGAMCS